MCAAAKRTLISVVFIKIVQPYYTLKVLLPRVGAKAAHTPVKALNGVQPEEDLK